MPDDDRVYTIQRLLREHLESPSLRHIKDPNAVWRLAREIVRALDRGNSPWLKWTAPRELLVKAAVPCWIPVEDLRDHLNQMDGPTLSTNDVAQRRLAFEEEHYAEFARDAFEAGCLAVYRAERAEGTEMPALIGVVRAHIDAETERVRLEQEAAYQARREEERLAAERRLLSGADCKWTPVGGKDVACRINGRLYRLTPSADKRLDLLRVDALDGEGRFVGRYLKRGDATKALQQIAYQPDL